LIDFGETLGDQIKLFSWKWRSIIIVNQEPVKETPRFESATLNFGQNTLKKSKVLIRRYSLFIWIFVRENC